MKKFDAAQEVRRLRRLKKVKLKRRHGMSDLDKYEHEILGIIREGGDRPLIQEFLREKRLYPVRSTIKRWLDKHEPV